MGAAVTQVIVGLFATQRAGYAATVGIYAVIAAAVLWIAAAGLRERRKINESKAETPPLRAFAATFRNRPFVRLIVAYLIASVAFALI